MSSDPHKYPQFVLRISPAAMSRLKYIASYTGRSANKEIEQAILQHIAKFEKENGTISLDSITPKS